MEPPRGRGKGFLAMMVMVPSLGLPPRRRGKCVQADSAGAWAGITPAWAGKSLFCFTAAVPIQDHPRMGGEKMLLLPLVDTRTGSPPHRRGKGRHVCGIKVVAGITPAWAGKSPEFRLPYLQSEDHPRVGGEKPSVCTTVRVCIGSPPRWRGKVADGLLAGACPGITPAWAGKSDSPPVCG